MARVADGSPLAQGFYTVSEAAKLIEVGSQGRIRNWLKGYPTSKVGPLLSRDYDPVGSVQELSFLDLLEVRFVEFFREQNVRLPTLRRALETAREIFGHSKPFALNHQFHAVGDGKDILIEEVLRPSAKAEGDRRLWSLVTRQHEMAEVIIETIQRGVTFDPETHVARSWRPRARFPNILIDPYIAYGRPHIPSGFPTEAIHDAWLAEGKDAQAVADWYGAEIGAVEEAIDFEVALQTPEAVLAA